MGHLVSLPTNRSPARAMVPGRSAAILFFTGVRYERIAEDGAAQPCAISRDASLKRPKAPSTELQA